MRQEGVKYEGSCKFSAAFTNTATRSATKAATAVGGPIPRPGVSAATPPAGGERQSAMHPCAGMAGKPGFPPAPAALPLHVTTACTGSLAGPCWFASLTAAMITETVLPAGNSLARKLGWPLEPR